MRMIFLIGGSASTVWTRQQGMGFHRKAGQDEERDGVSYSAPESMSELPLRHMMHAWREYMTATVGEKL